MIKGMHAMFYTTDVDATRTFLREVMAFPATDIGEGWLIFDVPEADLGCHPHEGKPFHEISFYCENIETTVATMKERGAKFLKEPTDQGWGIVAPFEMPGVGEVAVYQPKYQKG